MTKPPKKFRIQEQNRSSIDGEFVTAEYAKKHPKTTETQHVRHPVKPKPKGKGGK